MMNLHPLIMVCMTCDALIHPSVVMTDYYVSKKPDVVAEILLTNYLPTLCVSTSKWMYEKHQYLLYGDGMNDPSMQEATAYVHVRAIKHVSIYPDRVWISGGYYQVKIDVNDVHYRGTEFEYEVIKAAMEQEVLAYGN